MAKLPKKSLAKFDEAVDQFGGGAPSVSPPSERSRKVVKPRKIAKAKAHARKR
jgi:hypothetical protein